MTTKPNQEPLKLPRNRVRLLDAFLTSLKSPLGSGQSLSRATGRDSAGYASAGWGSAGRLIGGAVGALPGRGKHHALTRLAKGLLGVYTGGVAGETLAATRSNRAQDREFLDYIQDNMPGLFRTQALDRQLERGSARGLEAVLRDSRFMPPSAVRALQTRVPAKMARSMKKQALSVVTPGLQIGAGIGALSGALSAARDPRRSYPEEMVGGGLRGGAVGGGISAGALTGTALAQGLAPETYSRLLQASMNEEQGMGMRGLALAALLAPTLAGGYIGGRTTSRALDLAGGKRRGKRASASASPGSGHVPPSSFQANPLTPPKPIAPIKPAPVKNPVQPPAPKPVIGAGVGPISLPFKRKTTNYWGSKV